MADRTFVVIYLRKFLVMYMSTFLVLYMLPLPSLSFPLLLLPLLVLMLVPLHSFKPRRLFWGRSGGRARLIFPNSLSFLIYTWPRQVLLDRGTHLVGPGQTLCAAYNCWRYENLSQLSRVLRTMARVLQFASSTSKFRSKSSYSDLQFPILLWLYQR